MKKLTLIFPSYNSMWLFKSFTKAINIRIEPKKHLMCGLFNTDEIEMAITQFKAILLNGDLNESTLAKNKMPA